MKHTLFALALIAFAGSNVVCQDPERPQQKAPVVVMETSLGTIEIELNAEKAPITVKNFLSYVGKKHFDGLIFHRVMKDFMIQGGGYDKELTRKETDAPIKLESDNGLKNERGTIAMARTNDPDSASSQFFINTVDNMDKLDRTDRNPGYAVFGKVTKGLDVVDKIREVKVKRVGDHQHLPVETVVIKSATLKKADSK